MKLLLLLLPVGAFAFFVPGHVDKEDLTEHRVGKLPEERKANLAKIWGIDLNARKSRLERMSKKAAETLKQTLKSKNKLKKNEPISLVKLDEDDVPSLLEVNLKNGVAEYLFEGDINPSERQLDALEKGTLEKEAGNNRHNRVAYVYARKWPENTLYFYFHQNITKQKRATVRAAQAYIQENTCINFVESAAVDYFVYVHYGEGCSSDIGMGSGMQWLSLGKGCDDIGTIAHEFMHALGFVHTQSSSDRDKYVDIDLSDVNETAYSNFKEYPADQNFLYVPYEYGSVMHYTANAYVNHRGSFSILPKDGNYNYTLGNSLISFYDMLMINDRYNCLVNCNEDNSAVCQNGGYPNPRNCSICNCPRGYGGTLCNERPSGCGKTLEASEEWQQYQVKLGDATDNTTVRHVYTSCNDWITAPPGKKIQVRITKMENGRCHYGCPLNGIEIKYYTDQNVTNPIFCCEEFNNRIITSALNPTPIFSFNRIFVSTFDIEYRFVDKENTISTTKPAPLTTEKAAKTTEKDVTLKPTAEATTKKPTTEAPVSPDCVNHLTFSMLNVTSMYSGNSRFVDFDKHHYHTSKFYIQQWEKEGFSDITKNWGEEYGIGKVIDTDIYEAKTTEFDSFCPTLVKLRAFVSVNGTQFMTTQDGEAQVKLQSGWTEIVPVGYCSSAKACGATRNVRSVTAHDGGDIIYSTDSESLDAMNEEYDRYEGTLSPTVCWLF